MEYILYLLIIFIICIIILFNVEDFENDDIKFPFKHIYDDTGNKLNIIAISAPFRETKDEDTYYKYK